MHDEQELGRPSYSDGRHPLTVNQPLSTQHGPGRGRRRPPRDAVGPSVLQSPPTELRGGQARKKPKNEQPATGTRTVYVPVPVGGRGLGYGAWRFVRFVVLIALWLILTIFKVALSPFVHIMGGSMGGGRRPRWWD